jgi:hypothetical protein
MNAHEWMEVKGRRWCVGCDELQRRHTHGDAWEPEITDECPRTTPAARERDRLDKRGEQLTDRA